MTARYDEKMQELWTKCCIFNRAHPVGTRVRFLHLEGVTETVTTAPATVVGQKIAVRVDGLDDYVFVDSIRVMPLMPLYELAEA